MRYGRGPRSHLLARPVRKSVCVSRPVAPAPFLSLLWLHLRSPRKIVTSLHVHSRCTPQIDRSPCLCVEEIASWKPAIPLWDEKPFICHESANHGGPVEEGQSSLTSRPRCVLNFGGNLVTWNFIRRRESEREREKERDTEISKREIFVFIHGERFASMGRSTAFLMKESWGNLCFEEKERKLSEIFVLVASLDGEDDF